MAAHAPVLPQVACFDTAFHRTQPAAAQAFALPRRYAEEGVVRYGLHGLSYEYIASVLPGADPRAAAGHHRRHEGHRRRQDSVQPPEDEVGPSRRREARRLSRHA